MILFVARDYSSAYSSRICQVIALSRPYPMLPQARPHAFQSTVAKAVTAAADVRGPHKTGIIR